MGQARARPNRMGPASLPAPLSPSPLSFHASLRPLPDDPGSTRTQGRGDASPSTASAFRTRGYCCIVMLVASGPTVWFQPFREDLRDRSRPSPWSVFQRPAAFRTGESVDRQWEPAIVGPVRRAFGFARNLPGPSGGSNRIAASRQLGLPSGSLLPECFPAVPFEAGSTLSKQGFVRFVRAPRQFGQRLRATHCICGSLGLFQGTHQACFPTLLRASPPCLWVENFRFNAGAYSCKIGHPSRSTQASCAPFLSRTRHFCDGYSQLTAKAVDKTG
jgi:hypothetical protein